MATLEEIGRALKNAHAAGDVAAATKLAQAYQREKERANKGAAGQRGGMVEEGTISREEYMRQRGPVNEAFDRIPQPSRVYEDLPAEAVALGSVALLPKGTRRVTGSGSVFGVPKKPDFKAPLDLDTPQAIGVPERISRAQSVALGTQSLNPVRGAVETVIENVQQQQPGTQRAEFDRALTQSLRDNPNSTRAGQVAALTAGGGAQLGAKAVTVAPKLVSPAVASRFAGPGLAAQTGRFAGRGAVLAGAGATENYAYNVLAEAPNQYMEAGLPAPTVGERVDYAGSQILSPGGLIAAVAGPVGSTLYRGGRAAVAGTKNLLTSGGRSALAPGATAAAQGGTPIANLFTPSNVQRNVAAITPTTPSKRGRTAREEAIDLLLAKGLDADQTEKLTRLLSYDNYTSVDEMLFELANADIDQLAVAAARVGGEAKKTFREAFRARAAEMPERIRVQLRDAMALSGDELENFSAQMAARADEATADGYTAAYAQQVSDDTWAKMWDRLSVSPDTAAAISAGARLARNSYRGNPAQLEVARQLDELASALDSPGTVPPKLSTHALDYLDRGFGSLIAGQKKNNLAFAASLIEIQKAVRSAGLDADTGLNVPRGVYSQYKAASRAIDFGAKAFGRGTPLRDIKKQFSASLKDADEVFEDIVGEGRSVVDQALVMGWLRGAEDSIETATNPGFLIRQFYGSERQRAKLLEMMPQETDVMTAGLKEDQAKRIKALVGSELGAEDYKFGFTLSSGARAEGRAAVPSLFERQRQMLANQARVSGNSVTGEVTEAIAAQGGLQRAADIAARTLINPQDAARNAMLWAVQKVTTPAIFKPEVNRELGRILTTRGRDDLLAVIGEIRARQAATTRGAGTPPASGAAPPTPPTGGKAGGKLGTRAAGAAAIAAVAGDLAGGFGPGEIIGAGVAKAAQAIGPSMAAVGRMFSGQKISPEMQATLQQTAMGSIGGSAYGSQNDVNQDGVIDERDAYAGALAGGIGVPAVAKGMQVAGDVGRIASRPGTVPEAMPAGGYFGRQSMRPPGSGPSPREIELRQEWSTATPIVTQARTTAQSAQQAADAALQSKAPADIARAKDQKKALVGQLQEAQASRAGMDTPEDARLAETLASLAENTSDPVLLSTQISAARTSLDRLLTDLGGAVEGNLIPVRTTVQTRTQAPRSAADGPQERASVTRYAKGEN